MRRAPAKPVRACTLRNWCLVSHVTFQAPLHTSHLTAFTLHTTHFTLHSSHCTLHTAPFAVNTSLHTVLLRLHTSHFTLHTSHFTLQSSQSKLHTSHSTLHTSHCTLRSPNFTLPSQRNVRCMKSKQQRSSASCFLPCTLNKDSTLAAPQDCNSTFLRSRICMNLSTESTAGTHNNVSHSCNLAFISSSRFSYLRRQKFRPNIYSGLPVRSAAHMSWSSVDFCIPCNSSLLSSRMLTKRSNSGCAAACFTHTRRSKSFHFSFSSSFKLSYV